MPEPDPTWEVSLGNLNGQDNGATIPGKKNLPRPQPGTFEELVGTPEGDSVVAVAGLKPVFKNPA